jgi:hypothetical protein
MHMNVLWTGSSYKDSHITFFKSKTCESYLPHKTNDGADVGEPQYTYWWKREQARIAANKAIAILKSSQAQIASFF